mgnify:CR=1 FL=1
MLQQKFVAFAGVAGEQDELARVVTERNPVLRLLRLAFYAGTGMCQPGDHTHQQRFAGLFGKGKSVVNHVVGFLLVAGFEHWDQCEITVEAAVLFVL